MVLPMQSGAVKGSTQGASQDSSCGASQESTGYNEMSQMGEEQAKELEVLPKRNCALRGPWPASG